ncbi:hypothetical protein [Burkholderia contaminans]|uniref:hypothetical protein n=1 Tax=Burkholderia contaminans TaxID=488447 RepID=UPI00158A5500|nr:hypothetical protein [Burkholderia contaminans]
MKDLLITKNQVDSALSKLEGDQFVKQSDAQYALNIDNGGVLNIYFKKNGKTSFLSQGKNPDEATSFAELLFAAIDAE